MNNYEKIYKSEIKTGFWWFCDILGNIGWIVYYTFLIIGFSKTETIINILNTLPAIFIFIGLNELINERIKKLDRVLPLKRLILGFYSITFGGFLGIITTTVALIARYNYTHLFMLTGSILCFVFCLMIAITFKRDYK